MTISSCRASNKESRHVVAIIEEGRNGCVWRNCIFWALHLDLQQTFKIFRKINTTYDKQWWNKVIYHDCKLPSVYCFICLNPIVVVGEEVFSFREAFAKIWRNFVNESYRIYFNSKWKMQSIILSIVCLNKRWNVIFDFTQSRDWKTYLLDTNHL